MPKYKLTYFDVHARAETTRLIFAAAGIEFEDVRVPFPEWSALKPKTPMGQLPTLEVDGVVLCQSNAIARFVAKRAGFAGKTDIEEAQVDMVAEAVYDLFREVPKVYFERNEQTKEEFTKKFLDEIQPRHLGNLEKLLKQNKGGDGFFVGDSVTWADMAFCNTFEYQKGAFLLPNGLDNYPKLKALVDRVYSIPKVADWVAKRPKTAIPSLATARAAQQKK